MVPLRFLAVIAVINILIKSGTATIRLKYDKNTNQNHCLINEKIKNVDLPILAKCHIVYGHLNFHHDVKGTIGGYISEVKGCLFMDNTLIENLHFIKTTKFECIFPNKHYVKNNERLCVDEIEQARFMKNVFKQNDDIEFPYGICPACFENNYDENCKMLIGDFKTGKDRFTTMWNLTIIRGQLVVENVKNAGWSKRRLEFDKDLMDRRLFVYSMKNATVPAVHIIDSVMPPHIFFLNLEIQTHGEIALNVNISGYKMPRSLHRRLQFAWPHKKLEVDAEQEGECSVVEKLEEQQYILDDLLMCEKVIGMIEFDSTQVKSRLFNNWTQLITSRHRILIKGGRKMITLFNHPVSIYYSNDDFQFVIEFVADKICLDVNIMAAARSWMSFNDAYRVVYIPTENCTYYYGYMDYYSLRFENATSMKGKEMHGSLRLNKTEIRSYEGKDGDRRYKRWDTSMERFEKLKLFKKTLDIPYNVPGVFISACGPHTEVPDWLFTVPFKSDREKDLLLRMEGPGFKISREKFDKLTKNIPPERVDIDVAQPGECILTEPIIEMRSLDKCEYIVGDLILNEDTKGKTTTKLRQISGCIEITNTSLTDLDFIEFEVPYKLDFCYKCRGRKGFAITDNTNMCVYHKKFGVSRKYVKNNKPGCGSSLKDDQIHDGSVIIQMYDDETTLEKLSKIVELNGRIFVIGSYAESLNLFPNLVRITWNGEGPVIIVENNANLSSFALPSLKEINVKDKQNSVIFRNNPKLEINETTERDFKRMTGGTLLVENEKEEKEEEENDIYLGIAFGAGLSAGVVAILALIAVIIFMIHKVVVLSKKKKKSAVNGKKDKKKDEDSCEAKYLTSDLKTVQTNVHKKEMNMNANETLSMQNNSTADGSAAQESTIKPKSNGNTVANSIVSQANTHNNVNTKLEKQKQETSRQAVTAPSRSGKDENDKNEELENSNKNGSANRITKKNGNGSTKSEKSQNDEGLKKENATEIPKTANTIKGIEKANVHQEVEAKSKTSMDEPTNLNDNQANYQTVPTNTAKPPSAAGATADGNYENITTQIMKGENVVQQNNEANTTTSKQTSIDGKTQGNFANNTRSRHETKTGAYDELTTNTSTKPLEYENLDNIQK